MKNTLSFSCFLFILFFTITIHYSPLTTAIEGDCDKFLCDDDWNHVKAGEPYHFGPPKRGGGIVLGSVGDDGPCPRYGLMSPCKIETGDSFIFNPIVPNEAGLVPLQTPFAIFSAEKPSCNEPGILRMTRRDENLKFWHVSADGEFNTTSSCFEFITYSAPTDVILKPTYILQNCPYKCGRGTGECFQVGNKTINNGGYYDYFLTTANNPMPMEFYIKSAHPIDASA